MYKKFLLSIALLLFCFSNSIAASGFFFEGGIGSRYMNGSMNYDLNTNSEYLTDFEMSRDALNEAPLDNSVTDNNTLGWNNKLLSNINGAVGFRFSDKITTVFSAHLFLNKTGFGLSPSRDYPDVNAELGENITQSDLKSNVGTSTFSQINLRISQHIYLSRFLHFIGGVEYSFLKLDKGAGFQRTGGLTRSYQEQSEYKDNLFGMILGFGYELPISSKTSLMASGIYSFSTYSGEDLYFQNLDFNIGGVELGYTLRYYLK